MAQARLDVILTGDAKALIKAMKDAEKQVEDLVNELNGMKGAEGFDRLKKSANDLKKSLSDLNASVSSPKKGLEDLKKASSSATGDLINLGRVVQDAPYGFIGIANNLNPLIEGFGRTAQAAGGFGGAMKELGKSLVGAGGISLLISGISTALILFGDKLFSSSSIMKGFNRDLYDLSQAGDKAKQSLKELSGELDFMSKVAEGITKIDFASGFTRDFKSSQFELQKLRGELFNLEEAEKEAFKRATTASGLFFQNASRGAIDAINEFSSFADVPDEIVEKLKKSDRAYFNSAKKASADLLDIQKERKQKISQVQISELNQRVIIADNQRAEEEKRKQEYERFVSDTIAKAKELASFFDRTTIRQFSFEIDPRDSQQEVFRKAQEFIQRALDPLQRQTFPIKFGAMVKIQLLGLKEEIEKTFKKIKDETLKLNDRLEAEIERLTKRNPVLKMAQDNRDQMAAAKKVLDSMKEGLQVQSVQALTASFENLFSAIVQGGNPLKSFFQTLTTQIGSLIARLAAAAAVAGILSAVLGGGSFLGAKGFTAIFAKIAGFRADGGPVQAGKRYVVGERGPELFVPKTSGNIVSNEQMRNGVSGAAPGKMAVAIEAVIRGRDLALILAREAGYQNRNV